MANKTIRCQDCLDDCTREGIYRVKDRDFPGEEWYYCAEHLPSNDPGVEVLPND